MSTSTVTTFDSAELKERIGVPGYEALAGVMDFLSSAEEAEAA